MERLLNIWKERSLYRADFIQQLKLAIEDSNSPRPPGRMQTAKELCWETVRYMSLTASLADWWMHDVCTEETKAVKRSYQKIQEDEDDEDDDYRNYTSPRNTGSSATQLVGFQDICPGMAAFIPHLSLAASFWRPRPSRRVCVSAPRAARRHTAASGRSDRAVIHTRLAFRRRSW